MIRKSRLMLSGIVAISCLVSGCGDKNNPASPDTPAEVPPAIPGNVILRDSTMSSYMVRFLLQLPDPVTAQMRVDSTVGKFHKGSLTSDSNNVAAALPFPNNNNVMDSTLGCMFFLKADEKKATNFLVFFGQNGGSLGNTPFYFGIGFGANDSIMRVNNIGTYGSGTDERRNLMAIATGKWYLCKIEYAFSTELASCWIDSTLVDTVTLPSSIYYGFDRLIVYRDGNGANGPAPYYLNDVAVYKR